MKFRNLVSSLLFVSLQAVPFLSIAASQMVSIVAGADNTLYEDADGSVSNGSGAILLAGRNNLAQDSIRRTVLYFDVAGNLPHGARVESAVLTLYMDRGNGGLRDMRLHRLLADWGEGDSAVDSGGLGAPAADGDATWLHSFYPDTFWGPNGGRFAGRVSAIQTVGDSNAAGLYTWGSSARMVDDVRRWLRHPEKNYGWILLGDETEPQTAKRFLSRESVNTDLRPVLEIHYSMPE